MNPYILTCIRKQKIDYDDDDDNDGGGGDGGGDNDGNDGGGGGDDDEDSAMYNLRKYTYPELFLVFSFCFVSLFLLFTLRLGLSKLPTLDLN